MNQPTWNDFVRERQRREDEPIAKKYALYKHLGHGHMRPELCRVPQDW